MVQLLPTGSHEIVNIINSIESSESFINSESVIYIDANPNKIISAPIGSIFYRRGQECYVLTSAGKETKVDITGITNFSRLKYNLSFYKNRRMKYRGEWETWEKIDGGDSNIGWKFISRKSPLVSYKQLEDKSVRFIATVTPMSRDGVMVFDKVQYGMYPNWIISLKQIKNLDENNVDHLTISASVSIYKSDQEEELPNVSIESITKGRIDLPYVENDFIVMSGSVATIINQFESSSYSAENISPAITLIGMGRIGQELSPGAGVFAVAGDVIKIAPTILAFDGADEYYSNATEYVLPAISFSVEPQPRIELMYGDLDDFIISTRPAEATSASIQSFHYITLPLSGSNSTYGRSHYFYTHELRDGIYSGIGRDLITYTTASDVGASIIYEDMINAVGDYYMSFETASQQNLPVDLLIYAYIQYFNDVGYVSSGNTLIPYVIESGSLVAGAEWVNREPTIYYPHSGSEVKCLRFHDLYDMVDLRLRFTSSRW